MYDSASIHVKLSGAVIRKWRSVYQRTSVFEVVSEVRCRMRCDIQA